jgi:hypothetical protein
LGEEYTDIWPRSSRTHRNPTRWRLALLVLWPALPSYALARLGSKLSSHSVFRKLPTLLEVAAEVNLALFYMGGTYHEIVKRLLGVQYVSAPSDFCFRHIDARNSSHRSPTTPTLGHPHTLCSAFFSASAFSTASSATSALVLASP